MALYFCVVRNLIRSYFFLERKGIFRQLFRSRNAFLKLQGFIDTQNLTLQSVAKKIDTRGIRDRELNKVERNS